MCPILPQLLVRAFAPAPTVILTNDASSTWLKCVALSPSHGGGAVDCEYRGDESCPRARSALLWSVSVEPEDTPVTGPTIENPVHLPGLHILDSDPHCCCQLLLMSRQPRTISATTRDWKFGSSCSMPTLVLVPCWVETHESSCRGSHRRRGMRHPLRPEIEHGTVDGLYTQKK